MSRIKTVDPAQAEGTTKELLEEVHKNMGMTPTLIRAMAASPAVFEGYLSFRGALGKSSLDAKLQEQISLVVSQLNECSYCLAAHTAAAEALGLNQDEILASRRANSKNQKTHAALEFTRIVVEKHAKVTDEEVERLKAAGYDDAEVAEIVASVAFNIFTNYFHHVADTEIDFPPVETKLAS